MVQNFKVSVSSYPVPLAPGTYRFPEPVIKTDCQLSEMPNQLPSKDAAAVDQRWSGEIMG